MVALGARTWVHSLAGPASVVGQSCLACTETEADVLDSEAERPLAQPRTAEQRTITDR